MPALETPASAKPSKVPAKPLPVSKAAIKTREVVYPELGASFFVGDKPITEALAKKMLKWESEKELASRMMAENKDLTEDMCKFKSLKDEKGKDAPIDPLFKDEESNWIVCWNNLLNRP